MPDDDIRALILERDRLLQENDQLLQHKKQLVQEKDQLVQNIKQLVQEKDRLVQEKDQLIQEKKQLVQEKDRLVQEKKTLVQEKDRLVQEKKTLVQEKDRLVQEKKTLVQEKDQLVQEKKTLVQEKDQLVQEKKTLVQEKDQLVQERDQLFKEKQQLLQEKDQLAEDNKLLQDKIEMLKQNTQRCPTGWQTYMSSCYQLSPWIGTWEDAKQDCERKGAHLVIFNDVSEERVVHIIGGAKTIWMGLTAQKDQFTNRWTWTWVDGSFCSNWNDLQLSWNYLPFWSYCAHADEASWCSKTWRWGSCQQEQHHWMCEKELYTSSYWSE
ncbi:trichohyalin-like isoform X1 [Micropterus dolomieu]|uniref:trichohyalin-like isoform X1 n=1 Tax=Micropterus dolomieu TaxID=147949 RepID=UPI001E8CF874|nr:trichohyalin-like isoform X1 [Micropterus dolomieu]XP_045899794.1 trichohyalin-like isoform X1 [Micropterus dolomieu]